MYYILEVQKQADGSSARLIKTADTREEAESKFHEILQYAAVSKVYAHSAAIISDEANLVKRECYYHYDVPEELPEPEQDPEEEESSEE